MDIVKAVRKKHRMSTAMKMTDVKTPAFLRLLFSTSNRRNSIPAFISAYFFGDAPNMTFHSLDFAIPMSSTVFPVGTVSSTCK